MTQVQFNENLLSLREKLHRYALSLTSNSIKADDLLQETMYKALSYRDKFTQNTNFKAWVYTIMKNTFINDYRRNIKMKNTFSSTGNELHLTFLEDMSHPSPESVYSSGEIMSKIEKLHDDYKIPFTMFVEGFKYKEIAEELELPLGTVKSRIFFTRKKLVEMLPEFMPN